MTSVNNALEKFPHDTVVVNTAAKTNLEWCEIHKGQSHETNVIGAINVATACKTYGLHLIHVSDGSIFDGEESEYIYDETETPSPASWYASTKAEADWKILDLDYQKITIVRPRQLMSTVPNPTNMLTKFLSMSQGSFIDSKNSLTCIEDMKEMIQHLISTKSYGIYNLANVGTISPYQVACILRDNLNSDFVVNKISYEDYLKTLHVKRVNTILNVDKLISIGYTPRSVLDAVTWCVSNYGNQGSHS